MAKRVIIGEESQGFEDTALRDDLEDHEENAVIHVTQADRDGWSVSKKRIANLEAAAKGILYTEDVDSTEAYSKQVPAGAMPYAELGMVGGKTMTWNQLALPLSSQDWDAYKTDYNSVSFSDGKCITTLNRNVTLSYHARVQRKDYEKTAAGHKLMLTCDVSPSRDMSASLYVYQKNSSGETSGLSMHSDFSIQAGKKNRISSIMTTWEDIVSSRFVVTFYGAETAEGDTIEISNFNVFNLTQMFGAGNEPSTVEEFRAMFPADYYPYSEPTLLNADVVSVDSVGKNLLNPSFVDTSFHDIDGMVRMDDGWFKYTFTKSSVATVYIVVPIDAMAFQKTRHIPRKSSSGTSSMF